MLTITRNKETQEATIMQKKNPRISQSCTLTSNILSLFLNPTCTPQNESKAGKAKCKTEQSFLITRTRIITDFKGDKLIHMRKNMPTDVSCDQFFFLITPLFSPPKQGVCTILNSPCFAACFPHLIVLASFQAAYIITLLF